MRQRQRDVPGLAYRDAVDMSGIVFVRYRLAFHYMHQRIFVRFMRSLSVSSLVYADCYPSQGRLTPFWQAYCWAKSSSSGASSVFRGVLGQIGKRDIC